MLTIFCHLFCTVYQDKIGGKGRAFKILFSITGNELLVISSNYHLFTATGPMLEFFYISKAKIAFLSDKSFNKI